MSRDLPEKLLHFHELVLDVQLGSVEAPQVGFGGINDVGIGSAREAGLADHGFSTALIQRVPGKLLVHVAKAAGQKIDPRRS